MYIRKLYDACMNMKYVLFLCFLILFFLMFPFVVVAVILFFVFWLSVFLVFSFFFIYGDTVQWIYTGYEQDGQAIATSRAHLLKVRQCPMGNALMNMI